MKKYEEAHFCTKDGMVYAGTHLILDIWEGKDLGDIENVNKAFLKAVEDCGATLLHIHLHHFGEGMGVTGVAVLEESHITIHTWPEVEYAAIDIFLCGNLNPNKCVEAFKEAFKTDWITIQEFKRGVIT